MAMPSMLLPISWQRQAGVSYATGGQDTEDHDLALATPSLLILTDNFTAPMVAASHGSVYSSPGSLQKYSEAFLAVRSMLRSPPAYELLPSELSLTRFEKRLFLTGKEWPPLEKSDLNILYTVCNFRSAVSSRCATCTSNERRASCYATPSPHTLPA